MPDQRTRSVNIGVDSTNREIQMVGRAFGRCLEEVRKIKSIDITYLYKRVDELKNILKIKIKTKHLNIQVDIYNIHTSQCYNDLISGIENYLNFR